jgi:c-di-AMP phosphodiesterase-like protein
MNNVMTTWSIFLGSLILATILIALVSRQTKKYEKMEEEYWNQMRTKLNDPGLPYEK